MCRAKFSDADMYRVRSDYFLPLAPISRTNLRDRQKRGTAGTDPFPPSIGINCSWAGAMFFGRGRRALLSSSLPRFVAAHYALHGLGATRESRRKSAKENSRRRIARAASRWDYNRERLHCRSLNVSRYATSITPSTMRASLIYLSLLRVANRAGGC